MSQVLSLLELAQQSRRTANNSVNERSSRSHAVLQFVLRRGRTDEAAIEGAGADWLAAMCTGTASRQQVGKFTLVDLAGSERAADTQEADSNARAEGADITARSSSRSAFERWMRGTAMRPSAARSSPKSYAIRLSPRVERRV